MQQPKVSASPFLFCGANFSFLFSVDEIVCTLGEGAFGKVVECIDHSKYENIPYSSIKNSLSHTFDIKSMFCVSSDGARLALKIIKSIDRYREAAMAEVEVLEQLKSLDLDNRS